MNEVLARALAAPPGKSIQRGHRRFDEFLNLEDAARAAAVALLEAEINEDRERDLKERDRRNWEMVVGCILANALAAGQSVLIHYSQGNSTYQGSTPYKPDWLGSKQFKRVIRRFIDLGYFYPFDAPPQESGGLRSSFLPKPGFLARLEGAGIGGRSVLRDDAAAPVLLLRADDKQDGDLSSGRLVAYDRDATAIVAMSNELRAYNAFIAQQAIELTAGTNSFDRPDTSSVAMHRVFNQGSWDLGGRYYGAFWIGTPARERERITINGEGTAELDFSAFNLRALYHQAGIPYAGDPYDIPALRRAFDLAGWDWRTQGRPLVKQASLRVVNGAALRYQKLGFPLTITPTAAEAAIRSHHHVIASRFSKTCGLQLMRLDARIAEDVLRSALDAQIPVLPIHDGFRTLVSQVDWLRGVMIESYSRWVGFDPVIT